MIGMELPGSAMTPTDCATKSPIERLMASPGTSSFSSHTLLGPMSSPVEWSLNASILPPRSKMRCPSSLSQGLWSRESYFTRPFFPTTTHLESPALAQYMRAPLSKRVQQVVPEKDGSWTCLGNSSLHEIKQFFKARPIFGTNDFNSSSNFCGRACFM